MQSKFDENFYWITVIVSFWLTRLFNPLGITPGDASRYQLAPESNILEAHVIVQNIYWYGGILFGREIIFSFILFIIIYYNIIKFYRESEGPKSIIKFIIIFNPMYILFIAFPSKETILLLAMIYFYKFAIRETTLFNTIMSLIFLYFIFRIRLFYTIPFIYIIFLKLGFGKFQIAVGSALLFFFFLNFTSETLILILQSISDDFVGYEIARAASTNRLWIDLVSFNSYLDLFFYYLLGIYTVFLSALPSEIIIRPSLMPLFLIGIFKLYIIYYLLFKQKIDSLILSRYYIFLALILFVLVPLSIYNIGSSIRYQIPFFIIITLLSGRKFFLKFKYF